MTVRPDGPRDAGPEGWGAGGHGQGTDFPYTLESVRAARHSLDRDLRRLEVAQPAADDAVLVLSELVSNALRHARPLSGGTIRVAWWTEDSRLLRIAVTDGGGVPEAGDPAEAAHDLGEVDESAVDGRGLGIVGALAEQWGVEPAGTGDPEAPKTVWAAVRIHARHAAPRPPEKPRRDWPRLGFGFLRRRAGGGEAAASAAWVPRYGISPG